MQRFTAIFAIYFAALGLACLDRDLGGSPGGIGSLQASGAEHCARFGGTPDSSTAEPLAPPEGESACGRHCASVGQGVQPAPPTSGAPPAVAFETRLHDLEFGLAVAHCGPRGSLHRAPPRDLIALKTSFLL